MTNAWSLGRNQRLMVAIIAIGLAAVAAALVPPPAALAGVGGRTIFAALASAAIVAFAILPSWLWRDAPRAVWISLGAVALLLGIGAFAVGGYVQRLCTGNYGAQPLVIGTELTALGAAYRQANPELSTDDLLFDAAGVAERVWTPASIGRCRSLLVSSYFLWVPLLVVCVVATAQALPTSILSPARRGGTVAPTAGTRVTRYDVFVSYRHEGADKRVATELVAALESDGYRVAIDERDFPANASFLEEMERCVRESRFTVAVLSPPVLESGNTREEAVICKVLDMGDRQRRLIPMVIEPVSMPAWLYGIVGVDLTKHDPLIDPFDKLKATLGPPAALPVG